MMKLKEIVNNNYCVLQRVTAQNAYFNVDVYNRQENDVIYYNTFQFIVPLDDIGTAVLNSREKAITLMRWIRKALENKEFILISQTKFD